MLLLAQFMFHATELTALSALKLSSSFLMVVKILLLILQGLSTYYLLSKVLPNFLGIWLFSQYSVSVPTAHRKTSAIAFSWFCCSVAVHMHVSPLATGSPHKMGYLFIHSIFQSSWCVRLLANLSNKVVKHIWVEGELKSFITETKYWNSIIGI